SRGWIVTKQFSRFRNVRASQRHVAWLFRQPVDLCFFSKRILDCRNQIFELNRVALAEIEDVEKGPVILKRRHCTLDNVVNVSVVASRRAVAELVDRLARVNASRELMDCQIWSLPRTVNSKVAQCDDLHLIKMRVCRTKKFASDFCCGVRAER